MSEDTSGDDIRLIELLARVPQSVEPPHDVWPAIASAVESAPIVQDDALRRLAPEVVPPGDLWGRIAASIDGNGVAARNADSGRQVLRRKLALPFAAAAAAAFLFLAIAQLLSLRQPDAPAGDSPTTASTQGSDTGSFDPADVSDWPGLGAFDTPEVLAEARDVFSDQIAVVQRERAAIEASLALYPGDPSLLELWRYTYETELLLIDDATRVLANI